MRYPLTPWPLAVALVGYAALLYHRPASFLLLLPVIIPVADLGLWTGWMTIGESDLFVAVTAAVLLIRVPATRADCTMTGAARVVLIGLAATWLLAAAIGILSPLGAEPSDNPFLRPDNALRLAKGLAEAVLLLPWLRQQQRAHGNGVSLLGWGMAGGIAGVTLVVLAERSLFAGIWDFSAEYRVAGPFSSMRVGGGHIGAYIVLALPMALCLPRIRPRWLGFLLLLVTCLLGGYTLIVTFARTAYAAGLIAMGVAALGWMRASVRQNRQVLLALVPLLLVAAALGAAANIGGMRDRFAGSMGDLRVRQENWRAGLAVRDRGAVPTLFGMGLGTYQRAMLMRSQIDRPSDIALRRDAQGAYVAMRIVSPFFFGQKIVPPSEGDMHLSLQARTPDAGTTLGIIVCDKVLLYADQCRGGSVTLAEPNMWRTITLAVPAAGLGQGVGWLRRPVEIAFAASPTQDRRIELRDIALTDNLNRSLLANGDFASGLERWIFTDDSHVSWRMLSVYLMLWFETGIIGVTAFLAFCGVALAGGIRAAWRGSVTGAAVAGSMAGFMVCGLFDDVLEAPRLATLFFLICLCGLVQWEDRRPSSRL